jgi:hypothetical protein
LAALRRGPAAATALAALLWVALAGVPLPAAAAEADREAFQTAERGRRALEGSGDRMSSRGEWDRVIGRYRELVRRFPRSGYSDDALLAVGDLSRWRVRFQFRTG